MGLLVDGIKLQISDLTPYETSIAEVATTEGIDVTTKANIAALEIGLELQQFLIATHSAAIYSLAHVVVTEGLRQWHTLRTLATIFRDAHHQQLNERHKQKWREYERLARYAKQLLLDSGVGLVYRPIPKAPTPALGQTAGNQPARTYYVKVSWVDADGREGAASESASFTAMDGTALTVAPATAPGGKSTQVFTTTRSDCRLRLHCQWARHGRFRHPD
jgi:hypothetical protein